VESCLACEAVVSKGEVPPWVLGAVCALDRVHPPFQPLFGVATPSASQARQRSTGGDPSHEKLPSPVFSINTGNSLNSCNSPICYS
jgi:hypothetical protein